MFRELLSLSCSLLIAASWAAVPRNAFIARPAESRSALIAQLEKEAAVRDRYQRHFGMTYSELKAYFSTLTPGVLGSDGLYEVFNVPKTGVLRSRILRLRKGTRVWKDSSGQAILMMICGNPLTRGPKKASTANPVALVTRLEERDGLRPFDGQEAPEVVVDLEPIVLLTSSEPVEPVVEIQPNDVVANVPIVPDQPVVPATPTGPAVGALAGAVPWFFAPGVAGLAVGLPFVVPGDGGGSAPVPEPATLLALGAGAALLVRRRSRSL